MNKFNLEEFKNDNNLNFDLNENRFEDFRRFNPSLTLEIYNYLRENHCEWKIICGLEVKLKYSLDVLRELKHYDALNSKVYLNRFSPEFYLITENWLKF